MTVSFLRQRTTATSRRTKALRLPLIATVALIAVGLSGCALEHRSNHVVNVTQSDLAAGGEPYFNAGPVTYQIQTSRQLNPFSTEDVQYLAGVSNAQNLPADELWFGVFLWAKNQSGRTVATADNFELVDSAGTVYHPVRLNPSVNLFAWTRQELAPDGTEPGIDTPASSGPTGGSLVLFALNNAVYSNRPLTLRIYPPGGGRPSNVSLDL